MPVDVEQHASVQHEDDWGAVDVHSLMSSVTLRSPEGVVTVRGMVQKLRYAPNKDNPQTIYGDLRDLYDQTLLTFRCPADAAPGPDETAILRGTLRAKVDKFHGGFVLELVGRKIGGWAPQARIASKPVLIRREQPKLPLARLIAKSPAKRVILLGTELGIADARHTLSGSPGLGLEVQVVSMTLADLQEAIRSAAAAHSAICLLRGGGDPQLFQVFNDTRLIASLLDSGLPFYTAVGHATDLTLADKYADESFVTPSALGSSYADACKAQAASEALQKHARQLETNLQELRVEMSRRVRSARQSGLEDNLSALAQATASLQKLPADLRQQVSDSVLSTMRPSPQEVLKVAKRQSRWNSWVTLVSIFLAGIVAGGLMYHVLEMSRIKLVQDQLQLIQQQTAPNTLRSPPLPSGRSSRRR